MADLVAGERIGAFVMFVDKGGLHHAVRCAAVLALSDADGDGSDKIMQLTFHGVDTLRQGRASADEHN